MDLAVPIFDFESAGGTELSSGECDQYLFWEHIRDLAIDVVKKEDFLQQYMQMHVIGHGNFSSALISLLSTHFSNGRSLTYESWCSLLQSALEENSIYEEQYGSVIQLAICDLKAILKRDPAASDFLSCFLYFKGFQALQAHRLAHVLWRSGRKSLALLVQSTSSQVYGVDIHPNAVIGPGLMIDHATGLVVGETTRIGSNCTLLHGVTLGSTGKQTGKRHPTIGDDVLIGCAATILGDITIGNAAKIGSGSIVLKSIPPRTTAVGNPARVVGRTLSTIGDVLSPGGVPFSKTFTLTVDGKNLFDDAIVDEEGRISLPEVKKRVSMANFSSDYPSKIDQLFCDLDVDNKGVVDVFELEKMIFLSLYSECSFMCNI